MFDKLFKIVIGYLVAVMILLFFIIREWPDQYVHIVFCDVGQGDSILIYRGFSQVVVDSGVGDEVLRCLNRHLPFWDRSIELAVATHYDNDHIGGFEYVFDFYNIDSFLTLPLLGDSKDFESFKGALNKELEQGMVVKRPFLGQKMSFTSGVNLITLSNLSSNSENDQFLEKKREVPKGSGLSQTNLNTEEQLSDVFFFESDSSIGENNLSIVLLFEYLKAKILLTGDLEEEGEKAMIEHGLTTPINILKVGHHGSKTSSSLNFLQQLQPEVAIISCGKNNKYGHPDSQVMERFSRLGVEVFRTDLTGEVEIITDGENYWFAEK